ncbi:MAG TPA: hypothetical protein VF121_19535 [Thermoanaerobaculia bacterium]|nr:hypothetical protein [Thermoanaerobaculia bacterium]
MRPTPQLFSLALVFALTAAPAAAQPPQPLTNAEVACNAAQLTSLLARSYIRMASSVSEKPVVLSYTYGNVEGGLAGLAYTEQFETDSDLAPTPEHHLWFTGNPHEPRLLRNPNRPQLDAMSLTRSRLNSDLVDYQRDDAMAVVLDPTADPANNQNFATLLVIDNIAGLQGVATDAKPGRGLAGLLQPCHMKLSPADLHALSVLAKTVRSFAFSTSSNDTRSFLRSKLVAIYRGEQAQPIGGGAVRTAYRIDVHPIDLDGTDGRASFELAVDIEPDGGLGGATLQALPACTGAGQRDCTTTQAEVQLAVIKPVHAGEFWSISGLPLVCANAPKGSACKQQVSFSFAERLAGTSWLRPLE